jgi:hypothetical protein
MNKKSYSAIEQENEILRNALLIVWQWNFPPSGVTWDDGTPMSYGIAFGSNGERDYMRAVARTALQNAEDL